MGPIPEPNADSADRRRAIKSQAVLRRSDLYACVWPMGGWQMLDGLGRVGGSDAGVALGPASGRAVGGSARLSGLPSAIGVSSSAQGACRPSSLLGRAPT